MGAGGGCVLVIMGESVSPYNAVLISTHLFRGQPMQTLTKYPDHRSSPPLVQVA